MRRFLALVFLLVFAATPARALAGVVALAPGPAITPVYAQTEILADPAGTLGIDQVRASHAWAPLARAGYPAVGTIYWLHFAYTAPAQTKPWYLFLGYKPAYADAYFVDGADVVHERSGNALAFRDRAVKALGWVSFELAPSPERPADVYLRIVTHEPRIALAINAFDFFWTANEGNIAFGAMVGGVLITLLLSSTVLAVMLRRRVFAAYALYVFIQLLYRANDVGGAMLFSSLALPWARTNVVLDGLSVAAGALFVATYLQPHRFARRLHALNGIVAVIALGYAAAAALGVEIPITWAWRFAFVYAPLWILTGLVTWRRGDRQGLLFLAAWLAFLVGTLALNVLNLGIGRGSYATEYLLSHGPYFGLMVEGVLLSLSLSFELRQTEASRAIYAELAITDALTGIPNRRAFNETIEREWARAARFDRPLTVIIFDIDLFKSYNDLYGHLQGDVALRSIATAGSSCVQRAGDLFARYGGEEFVAVLTDTDLDGGVTVAEIVRRVVDALQVEHRGSTLGMISLSAGVAQRAPGIETSEALLQAADTNLYRAKARGRNRIGFAQIVGDGPRADRAAPIEVAALT